MCYTGKLWCLPMRAGRVLLLSVGDGMSPWLREPWGRIMCARFMLKCKLLQLAEEFDLVGLRAGDIIARYNIAPTQQVSIVRLWAKGQKRSLDSLRWGLIPKWAKDASIGNRMINARAETAAEKPSFRSAFRRQRCLVPATGFYEWRKEPSEGGLKSWKQPFLIQRQDERIFALAGLWESWEGAENAPVESFAILTTDANEFMKPYHDRMPVLIGRDDYDAWLDPDIQDAARLEPLLRPFWSGELTACPVSRYVNSPRNEGPACIEPAERAP